MKRKEKKGGKEKVLQENIKDQWKESVKQVEDSPWSWSVSIL